MGGVAIIAEYNPLHNGHLYHLTRSAADCGADAVFCYMSGNFTERGDAAVLNKYTRAALAVKHGVDIVIEIPTAAVLSCAERYALAAAKLVSHTDGVSHLSFGSECGDIRALAEAADSSLRDAVDGKIKTYLAQGVDYPAAYSRALSDSDMDNGPFADPNNILGIEYLRALRKFAPSITPYTFKRLCAYNADSAENGYMSATAIRAALETGAEVSDYMPADCAKKCRANSLDCGAIVNAVRYAAINGVDVSDVLNVSEGIENRIFRAVNSGMTDYDELINALKTKRYTTARIKRTLLDIALDIKDYPISDIDSIDYARVLAVASERRELIGRIKLNALTRSTDRTEHIFAAYDERADILYNALSTDKTTRRSVVIVDRKA